MVATADNLDASTLEPVEGSFLGVAGHCADLVPDDHTGNELLSHPFRCPLRLATPSEEAVVGLGLDDPGPHLFLARRWVGVKTRGSLWRKSSIARVVLPLPPPPLR